LNHQGDPEPGRAEIAEDSGDGLRRGRQRRGTNNEYERGTRFAYKSAQPDRRRALAHWLARVKDLRGGLQALFNLEGGVLMDSGTSGQGNHLCGRQADVGLKGSFGTLTVGRQTCTSRTRVATMRSATWGLQ
jgi:hypothetical protein